MPQTHPHKQVSVRFNKICQGMLNIGLHRMMRRHASNLKRIKSQLPRRESERRNHALAKHADILTCIETRMSMLSMTYTKYIDLNLCCFIPGKIVDEVMAILSLINSTTRPLRAHEVLQELRDISSMAIDHFDDKIAPTLKKSFCDMSTLKLNQSMFQSECPDRCLVRSVRVYNQSGHHHHQLCRQSHRTRASANQHQGCRPSITQHSSMSRAAR